MTQPERVDGSEVRHLSGSQVDEIGPIDHAVPDSTATHNSDIVRVEQHLQHHLRVVRRIAFVTVVLIDLAQVKRFNEPIDDMHRVGAIEEALSRDLNEEALLLIVGAKVALLIGTGKTRRRL